MAINCRGATETLWAVGGHRLLGCRALAQTRLNFSVAQILQIQLAVVILTSSNFLGISAETADIVIADLEDGAERATVLAGVVVQTDVILAAIIGVSMTAERTSGNITNIRALESASDLFNFALGDLISPGADTGFAVVSESRSALVTTSLTVPAGPEDVTFVLIREDTVKARAVRSADGSLDSITVSTVDVVDVIAVLAGELGVGVVESESVTTNLQFGFGSLTLPVLVARAIVGKKTILLRAGKLLSRGGCDEECRYDDDASHCALLKLLGRI